MKHISLFSGQGGFDLAAEWMGWENIAHCEWNPFGQRILKYYWPNAKSYSDITKTSFLSHRGQCDILTGGFPCQPYSTAGKRLGKEDERHLWPHMLRAIREIRPRWVVGENVRGLISWNGGLVFDEVQADLEAEGYEVLPFLLPAVGVNAPHRRERIWFIAYCADAGVEGVQSEREDGIHGFVVASDPAGDRWEWQGANASIENRKTRSKQSGIVERGFEGLRVHGDAAHAWHVGLQKRHGEQSGFKTPNSSDRCNSKLDWENFPTQHPVCSGNDGISSQLDGNSFSRWRAESIKAAGNAIVPQVALQIFKAIDQYENLILQ
ncbi:DNA cytosine methyltransferase [Dyadobacter fermentans]|uniref:DNA cytosine methyltransferase n=1 Tax=Dyadobacter fermentans TaxID=94254 RepID=UPI001CC144C3|nr:DNA cytosine methyltransferase [Dyadobacter fermentans]MBZ1361982.1 DNA cytosine methyltransferase [Dyadobacter fermentans]